jgi:hypothetical protein
MRKITTGVQGGPILGTFTAQENNLQTIETNVDIILDPNGSGIVKSTAHTQLQAQSELRLSDSDSAQYAAFKAPSSITSSYTLTLPTAAPAANGYALLVNTDGSTSFGDLSLETNNTTTDGGTYYLAIMDDADAGDGSITSLTYSNTKLTFVPSTGTLSCSNVSTGNVTATGTSTLSTVDINAGNIDGTTIGSASAAAGTFTTLSATSITETSSIAYKENVNPITNALDAILNLAGVTYDRKDGSSKNEAGLIAEDTAKVLPNIVTYKDGKPEGINYTKLSAYLIEAVKDLTAEIKDLKNRG